jgi:glucokinase
MRCVGVDLGGTNLRAALVDTSSGALLRRLSTPTRAEEGPPAVIGRMADLISEATSSPTPAEAVGIGVPGLYDPATNIVRSLPNLPTGWERVPLGEVIAARTGHPTYLINDARAFVLAEATFGAGRGAQNVVGITLGTGIGGGVVIAGRLYLGLDGTAGEVGHQIIDYSGARCSCGSRGCLEAYASGPAIATLGIKAVRQGRTTTIRDLVGGDLNLVTPEVIVQAAEGADAVAIEILGDVGELLGIGVATLITLFSPDVVVIGGGVAGAGEWLLRPIREVVRQRCCVTPVERVRIVPATLGKDAGAVGAALWAAQRVEAAAVESRAAEGG